MDATTSRSQSERSFGYVSTAAVLAGLLVVGLGLLLVPQSVLGGAWIAAIGASLGLAGLLRTPWAGRRFGLSDRSRWILSLSLVALAVVLTVAFLVLNVFGGFETVEVVSATTVG